MRYLGGVFGGALGVALMIMFEPNVLVSGLLGFSLGGLGVIIGIAAE